MLWFAADFNPTDFFSAELGEGGEVVGKGMLLLKLMIKGSDISNPGRPYDIASKWCVVQKAAGR